MQGIGWRAGERIKRVNDERRNEEAQQTSPDCHGTTDWIWSEL